MKPVKIILCALSLLVAPLTVSWADSPEYINYQGLLNGADGQPLPTGNYPMEFNIYDQANLGTKQWGPFLFDGVAGDGHGPVVPVVNGRFNVIIGPLDTDGDSIIGAFGTDTRFVEIAVNGAPILPRQQFLSTPYAFSIPNVTPNASGVDITGITTITGNTTVIGNSTVNGSTTVSGNSIFSSNVGIGTSSPASRLTILQSQYGFEHTDGARRLATFVDLRGGWLGTRSNHPLNFYVNDGSPSMVLDTAGRFGIGTPTPTQAKLVVNGSSSGNNPALASSSYILKPFTSVLVGGNATMELSIYADGYVAGSAFFAFSDERIKTVHGRSDSTVDLQTLRGIEIADYHYKDLIAKGGAPQKKVIAQQVEQVYPQAVSKITDVVPDIYQQASFNDGWVALSTDLKKGDRVKLISDKAEGVHEVMEVRDGAFRTGFNPEGDQVFVYGREVNDFRTVDYEAIAMLNVSATQELARRLEAQEAELVRLRTENADLAGKLASMVARDQLLDARLTRLEKSSSGNVQLTGLKVQTPAVD